MKVLAEVRHAIASQQMLNAVQPDLMDGYRVSILWGNALLRLRQSVDPRLRSDVRAGARSEVLELTARAIYNTVEIARRNPKNRIS